jgi:hypothetical protein
MSQLYKFYKVFISSPGDVKKERDYAEDAINKISDSVSESINCHFKVVKWEKLPPEYEEDSIQENLNKLIRKCHFFILILNKRYGSIEHGHTKSNTEREIETILEEKAKNEQKYILSYFKINPPNNDIGPQEEKVEDLKKRISRMNFVYKEYENPTDFKEKITHDLINILLRIELSPRKKQALSNFWSLRIPEKHEIPKLSIIYPPVPREMMAGIEETNFWEDRLTPNIFFEDHQAICKLRKTLQFIGFNNFDVHSSYSIPPDIHYRNIVWICMSRQPNAIKSLEKYSKIKRFEFHPRNGSNEPFLEWKLSSGEIIKIKSPLKKYLTLQRKQLPQDYEWNPHFGQVFAKDYAIIARFQNKTSKRTVDYDFLKEFFIAGIRGLGTWGAAWFIDRMSNYFVEYDENNDIQILLEVTYLNESISFVENVSDRDAAYFINENTTKRIKENIVEKRGENAL